MTQTSDESTHRAVKRIISADLPLAIKVKARQLHEWGPPGRNDASRLGFNREEVFAAGIRWTDGILDYIAEPTAAEMRSDKSGEEYESLLLSCAAMIYDFNGVG